MQPPDDKTSPSLLPTVGYFVLVAAIILLVYLVTPVWVVPVAAILLTFIATWFVPGKWRRIARSGHILFSLSVLLSTALFSTLSAAYAAGLFEGNELLDALLGNVAVMVLLSLAGAAVVATVFFIASFLLATDMSAEWILALHEVYGVTRQEARRLVKSMYLNTAYPFYMVENGEITKTKPEGLLPKLGGPGKVVIKPYNAVVFEQAGKTTRIEGPGTVLTKRHELQKEIVDLRKQSEVFIAENVLTKDHVPLTFHCSVGFCIESVKDTDTRLKGQPDAIRSYRKSDAIGGDYAVYKKTLRKAVYGPTAAGWKVTSRGATESKLREVVREYLLEDLYRLEDSALAENGSPIAQIIDETLKRLNQISPSWGTTLTGFSIKSVDVPEDIKDKLVGMWAARYAGKERLIEASDKRAALVEEARAKADAAIIEGRGRAEARLELYRRMLALESHIDKETLWGILSKLQSIEELQTMGRLLIEIDERRYRTGMEPLLPFLGADRKEAKEQPGD
jgi:regulator of protease activity HflC (stomatin/prohibitin superfamily)